MIPFLHDYGLSLIHFLEGKPNRRRLLYETDYLVNTVKLVQTELHTPFVIKIIRNIAADASEDMLNTVGNHEGLMQFMLQVVLDRNKEDIKQEVMTAYVLLTANSGEVRVMLIV